MRTGGHETTPESLASKSFRSSSTNGDQAQLEISGFGVRVPGGAPKAQVTTVALGFFMPTGHLLFDLSATHLPAD